MSSDETKVNQALQEFASSLAEQPAWIGLLKYEYSKNPKRMDKFDFVWSHSINDAEAAYHTHILALRAIEALAAMKYGNFQYTIQAGGSGIYIIVNLLDTWILAISYLNVGVISLDAVIESILADFQMITDAIYLK
jgi:hypothetical protein